MRLITNLGRVSVILILLTIIIGMSSLILLFSINKAGEKEILEGMKKAGNACLVSLDPNLFNKEGKEVGRLSLSDIIFIKNRVLEVENIALLNSKNIYSVKVGKREYPPEGASFSIVPIVSGVTPEFRKVMDIELKEGRFINKTDMEYKRRVCVVGGKLYERLREKKIIGKELATKVHTDEGGEEIRKFKIVGVLQKKIPLFASLPDKLFGATFLFFPSFDKKVDISKKGNILGTYQIMISSLPINDSIFIPWTVFNEKKLSLSLPPYTYIPIKIKLPEDIGKFVKDEEMFSLFKKNASQDHQHAEDDILCYFPKKVKDICDKIKQVLKERWGKDKIFVFIYSGTLVDAINAQTSVSNKLMIIIAIASLLLSGIILGSMMLISVGKRVSEIGIRRAYGARKKDIFLQFLVEGVILYAIGITIGSGVGILSSYLVVNKILLWEFSMPIYGIMISTIFVFLVGILSSLYPSLKAASVPPQEALRWE